jgi:hypothetical protein
MVHRGQRRSTCGTWLQMPLSMSIRSRFDGRAPAEILFGSVVAPALPRHSALRSGARRAKDRRAAFGRPALNAHSTAARTSQVWQIDKAMNWQVARGVLATTGAMQRLSLFGSTAIGAELAVSVHGLLTAGTGRDPLRPRRCSCAPVRAAGPDGLVLGRTGCERFRPVLVPPRWHTITAFRGVCSVAVWHEACSAGSRSHAADSPVESEAEPLRSRRRRAAARYASNWPG